MEFDFQKKKTYTAHWNNFSSKPRKFKPLSVFFKKFKNSIYNFLGFKLSVRLIRNKSQKDEAYSSYVVDLNVKKYRNELLLEQILSFLDSSSLKLNKFDIESYIDEFEDVFIKSPIKEQGSGFGYNEGVFFYTILKIINPTVVIESGVMKGFTTYLIDTATNQNCRIYCYDINLENNLFNSKKATYLNTDITKNVPSMHNEKVVALWDDHTSQIDRLKFSLMHNIEYNFFDDDLSSLNIHSDGWPPIPTISMLKDLDNGKINDQDFKWVSRNREGIVFLKNINDTKIVKDIFFHKTFPQLFPITGYKNHSQCSLVINKNSDLK